MDLSLVIPSFIAGLLTFLAPCTLPLVPGYLGFISGASIRDIQDPSKSKTIKRKIFINGLLYVAGFSLVFIALGTLFGLAGSALAQYRVWLSRAGGVMVIFFGLYMMHIFKLKFFDFLNREKKFNFASSLVPGEPTSSFFFGMTFAAGWTPCVGPILGTVLLLASTSGKIIEGAFLLLVFSLGLAVPFLLIALGIGHAAQHIKKITKYLNIISFVGGSFLVFLGILLVTDSMGIWLSYVYRVFSFLNYDAILKFL